MPSELNPYELQRQQLYVLQLLLSNVLATYPSFLTGSQETGLACKLWASILLPLLCKKT